MLIISRSLDVSSVKNSTLMYVFAEIPKPIDHSIFIIIITVLLPLEHLLDWQRSQSTIVESGVSFFTPASPESIQVPPPPKPKHILLET